jgi:uncharacterized RDD family membrane protein YckC
MLKFLKTQKKQSDNTASMNARFLAFMADNFFLLIIRYTFVMILVQIWLGQKFKEIANIYQNLVIANGEESIDKLAFIDEQGGTIIIVISLCLLIPGAIYHIYYLSSPKQATLGKRLIGIHVTDKDGKRITPIRSAIRYFVSLLPWSLHIIIIYSFINHDVKTALISALLVALWYDTGFFSKRKRTFHDIICGTLSKKGRL